MGFHAYTKPSDLIILRPPARSGIYGDGDLVSGNVRFALEYQGSTISSTFTAPNGTNLANLLTDRGVRIDNTYDRWDSFTGDWEVQTNKGRTTGNYFSTMATQAVYVADVDISVDVSATVSAGLIVRRNPTANNDYVYVVLDIAVGHVVAIESVSFVNTTKVTGATAVTSGATYTLRVVASGTTISVYLNGSLQGSFSSTVNSTTSIGMKHQLVALNDVAARFDNFVVAQRFLPVSTTATVRNYDGDIVYTTPITTDVLDIPDSVLKQRNNRGPYGWYRVYLTGVDRGDSQWRTAYGDGSFCRIPTVAGPPTFPANVAPTTAPIDIGVDEYAHGVMGLGTNRYQLSKGDQFWEVGHTVAENNALVVLSAPVFKTYWADYATSLRPRLILGAFGRGTQGVESTIVTPTVNLLKASIKAWEPRNEPQDVAAATFVADEMIPFYNAVKAADPTATVMGPGPVSFQDNTIQWIRDFFTAGGGNYCDALSVHAYNSLQGDIALSRHTLGQLKAAMATAGFTKPLYQTEQGFAWQYSGMIYPRHSGRWTALMYFMCELYGLPAENNFYWYDRDLGFDSFPMYWTNETGVGPQPVPIRTMQAEIGNRTLTAQFDFGTFGNDLYAGGTWAGGDGSKTVGLVAASYGQPDLTLDVSGAAAITCVDTWGNTFVLNVVSGRVTFPISEMPQWVRCPVGVTVTPVALGLTTNLATTATVTSDGASIVGGPFDYSTLNQTDLTRVNDNIQQNQYGSTGGGFQGSAASGYHIVNPVFPMTVTLSWASPVTVNRVILHSFPPWQEGGAPMAFTIDTWDGASWTTRYTYTKPATKSFAFTSGAARCTYETFWDDQWIFDAQFTAVSISKVRVVITNAMYGQGETALGHDTMWAPGATTTPAVTIRELQVFSAAAAPLAPRLRNPAMGGVTG